MSAARFRKVELARVASAMRLAGVESYDIRFDGEGKPIVTVRPTAANDTPDSIDAEIEALRCEIQNDAA
jgi:hypothetical protein